MTSKQVTFAAQVPFAELLGLELHSRGDEAPELRLNLKEAHMNSRDVAHGGVVMSMLDMAMAQAARHGHVYEPGQRPSMATIEMKTSFLRAARGALRAQGKLLHRSGSMAFCEATLLNGEGLICAHATPTFKYVRPRRDAGTGSSNP